MSVVPYILFLCGFVTATWLFSFLTLTAVDVKTQAVRFFLFGVLCTWLVASLMKREFKIHPIGVFAPVAALGLWMSFTTFMNPYGNPLALFDQLLLLSLVPFLSHFISSDKQLYTLLRCWVFACIPVCLYYFLQRIDLDPLIWGNQDLNPVGSTFGNRNYLVFYLLATLPFSVYLLRNDSFVWRILAGVSTLFILISIAISDSRAGAGILFVFIPMLILWYTHFSMPSRLSKAIRILCISVLGTLLTLLIFAIPFVLNQSKDVLFEWSHARIFLWEAALKMIDQQPIMGHGVGSFPILISIFRTRELGEAFGFYDMASNAHNVALEMLVEIGIVGFSIFLFAMIWLLLRPLIQRKWNKQNLTGLHTISLISFVGIILFSLIGEIANINICTLYSWLTLSLYTLSSYDREHIHIFHFPRWNYIPTIIIISICLIFVGFCVQQVRIFNSNSLTTHVLKTIPESNSSDAIPILNKAAQLDSNNVLALYMLSWAYLHQGNLAMSERLSELVVARDPYFSNIRYEKGVHAFLRGEYPLAIQELKHSVRAFPREYAPALQLAKAYYLTHAYLECKQTCEFLLLYKHRTKEVLALLKSAEEKTISESGSYSE